MPYIGWCLRAAVAVDGLLDAAADLLEGLAAEFDDVEPVELPDVAEVNARRTELTSRGRRHGRRPPHSAVPQQRNVIDAVRGRDCPCQERTLSPAGVGALVRRHAQIRMGQIPQPGLFGQRHIAVNVQGITGKKKDFTSLPMARIQAFSIETAGAFDLDAELELWFSGLGKVKLEFSGRTDVAYLNKLVAQHVL